jgi:O-antigen/teichoic acid export membrane protein
MISGASRRYLLMTFPFAILMTIAARPLVTQLYGGDYNQSVIPLQILVASYLIQISFGSANTILNMTGHEKYSAATLSMSICLNIMLNFALIPHYGATGASIATGVSLVTVQILQWRKVRTHLNLNSATINFPKKETHKKVT